MGEELLVYGLVVALAACGLVLAKRLRRAVAVVTKQGERIVALEALGRDGERVLIAPEKVAKEMAYQVVALRGKVNEMEALWDGMADRWGRWEGTLNRWLEISTRLEARVERPDPVVEQAQCGPACRTEMAPWPPGMEKVPWCATHRRWWAPEGPSLGG